MAIPAVLKSPITYATFAATAAIGTATAMKLTDGPGYEYYTREGDILAKDSGSMHWLTGPRTGETGPRGGGISMALAFGGALVLSVGASGLIRNSGLSAAVLGMGAGAMATGLGAAFLSTRNDTEVPMPTRKELTDRLGPEDPLRTRTTKDVDGNEVTLPDEVREGYAVIDGEHWPIAD